jgi:integrase
MKATQKHAKTRHISAETSKSTSKHRSAPHRFHFTERRVAALAPPKNATRAYYYDDEVRGLTVAVSRGGKKIYLLYRFVNSRPERITIAPCGDLSVQKARARAMAMNTAIVQGNNPAADRRALRDEATIGELFRKFLDEWAKPNLREKTWSNYRSMFTHLHAWELRKISSVRRADVIQLHAHLGNTIGKIQANRIVELLCAMYNRARKDWEFEGNNPATGIAFKERKRKRYIDGSELPAFFKSLAEELNSTIRDYILISLLTGARRSNVEAMEWTEINWRTAVWTIPAKNAKSDEDISVVLTPVVVNVLERRKASSLSPWVFPGSGRTGHLVEPKTAWKRILARAGLTNLRLHDLRRTLGSWQAATGASLPIIGKSLGHESLEATRVYAQLNLDPVRESVNRAQQAMLLAGGQPLTLEGK